MKALFASSAICFIAFVVLAFIDEAVYGRRSSPLTPISFLLIVATIATLISGIAVWGFA